MSGLGHRAKRLRGRREAARAMRAANPVAEAAPHVYHALVWRLGTGSTSVLDVGTGVMAGVDDLSPPVKIGLDAHRPYLEHRRSAGAVPLHADAHAIGDLFVSGAVDLVCFLDVIEHFTADDAVALLDQAECVAAKRVVVATPRGEFPQEGFDAYGLGGEELQRHRSSWQPEDFTARGYQVVVLRGFHGPENESFVEAFGPDAPPVDALVAWKDVAA
jgi:hypothetical protein